VRKAGNPVRVTAQLIDGTSDTHLWADKYDGAITDIFDLQDRITASVVGAIQPSVRSAEIERSTTIGHIFCLRARARGKSQQIRQFCAGGDFVNYTHPLILLDT